MNKSISTVYKDTGKRDELGLKATKTYYGNVSSLYIEDGFNVRQALDNDHIASIATAYQEGKYVPAIVVQMTDQGLKVVDGHHRYEAAKMAGVDKVELKNFTGDDVDAVSFMVTSSQGRNLNPVERATAYQRMIDSGLSIKDVSARLGRSVKDVKNHLTLMSAGPKIIEAVVSGQVGYAAAVEEINRNGEEGTAVIEQQIDTGKKVTRTTLARFTKSDHEKVMTLLVEMEVYDESLPRELIELIEKYKALKS